MSRLLFLLTTVVSLLEAVHADCYWPDGTENNAYQPCYMEGQGALGLCCAAGDVCMSNGLCMKSSEADDQTIAGGRATPYYRGSCTYRDWSQSRNCPRACLKGNGIKPHEAVDLILCPGSETEWFCADDNIKKANCSNGDYIVTLDEPAFYTTIGVSPSMSGSLEPSSPPTALGGGLSSTTMDAMSSSATSSATPSTPSSTTASTTDKTTMDSTTASAKTSQTTDSTTTTASATSSPTTDSTMAPAPASTTNSTELGPGGTSGTASAQPAASTTIEAGPGDSGSAVPAPASPEESPPASKSSAVPLAVGVSIGGASLIGAGVLGFFLWRRRRDSSSSLARAETPPPRDTPDDDTTNPVLASSLFRAGSLIRHPSHEYMNTIGRTGPTSPEAVTTASVFGGDRASSMRSNSIHSNVNTNTQHHVRSVSQDRFGADAVAMHDMRRTPPAAWGYPMARNGPAETIPEIPFDGRRLPPYHGTPVFDNNGFYSELPG